MPSGDKQCKERKLRGGIGQARSQKMPFQVVYADDGNAQPKSHSVRDCIACQQRAGKARSLRHGNGGDV